MSPLFRTVTNPRFFASTLAFVTLCSAGCSTKPAGEAPLAQPGDLGGAQAASSVEALFERSVAARGGRTAWERVQVVREMGTVRHELPKPPDASGGIESPAPALGALQSRRDLSRRFTTVLAGSMFYFESLSESGTYYEAGSDGDKVWRNGSLEGAGFVKGAERDAMLEGAGFFDDLDWRRHHKSATVSGDGTVGGEATTIVTIPRGDRATETRHYSKASGLLLQSKFAEKGALGKSSESVTRFETYSDFEGVKWPTRKIETTSEGVFTTVSGFRVEPTVDETEFEVPEHVRLMIALKEEKGPRVTVTRLSGRATIYADSARSVLGGPSYQIDVSQLGRVIFISGSFVRVGALALPALEALEKAIDDADRSQVRKKPEGCGILATFHDLYLRRESFEATVGCVRPERPGVDKLVELVFTTVYTALELEAAGFPKERRHIQAKPKK